MYSLLSSRETFRSTGSRNYDHRGVQVLKRQTEEEKELKSHQRQADALVKRQRQEAEQREKERQSFFATPVGQARMAYERADHVFQYSIDVMNQQAVIVAMVGSSTTKKTHDPVAILNSVCHEGWELVNGSFVFVEEGAQSRDKFMSSGQNVAIKGTTVGYYLFRRCDANRREQTDSWSVNAEPAELAQSN
jgi:hypothetical protein